MADVHSKEVRSYNMSRIKGKNTGPELRVRHFLHKNGYRYSLHSKNLPGKPDIVLKKYKTIIDVRGCFWHGHANCKYGDQIKSESVLITNRVKSAVERDNIKVNKWRKLGWRVIIIWDSCELEHRKVHSTRRESVLKTVIKKLKNFSDTNN